MVSNKGIEDLLLYELSSSKIASIKSILESEFNTMFLFVFTLSILFCFFLNFDFVGVLKRSAQAIVAVALFSSIFIGAKDIGMSVGNRIVSKNNFIWKNWQEASSLTKSGFKEDKKGFTKKDQEEFSISNIFSGFGSDFVGFLIWLMSHFALIFTKISFTVIFNMILLSIPIVAIVNIFPISNKALDGSLLSIMWIAVTPIVFALMLEILDSVATQHVNIDSFSFIAKGVTGIIFSLFLLSSAAISLKLVSSGTIGSAVNQTAQSFGTGMMFAASGLLKKYSIRGLGGMKTLTLGSRNQSGLPAKGLVRFNEKREKLFEKANNLRDSKALTAYEHITNKKPDFSTKERLTIAGATLAKPLESFKLASARSKLASKELISGNKNQALTTKYVKDEADIKEKPFKTIIRNGKTLKVPHKTKGPNRYYYDEKGQRRSLGPTEKAPVLSSGKSPRVYEKKKSYDPKIFESKKRNNGDVASRHHLAVNKSDSSQKGEDYAIRR